MLPELNLRGQVGTGQMEKMERLFQKKGTIFTKKQRKNGVPSQIQQTVQQGWNGAFDIMLKK